MLEKTISQAKNKALKLTCKIRIVSLDVTDKCNCRCQKCLLTTIQPYPDMTFDHFKTLLDSLPPSVKTIMWSGMGEPLLNPDTPKMIKTSHERGYHTTIFTNGTIPHKHLEEYLDEIFYNTETLKEENTIDSDKVTGNYVLQGSITDLYSWIDKTKLKKIMITEVRQMYPGVQIARHSLTRPHLIERDREKIKVYALQRGKKLTFAEKQSWKTCLAPWMFVNVSHNLIITPCCIHQHPDFFQMGTITEHQSLADIWHNASYNELRKKLQNGSPPALCAECGEI